jgi:hypothetical protein
MTLDDCSNHKWLCVGPRTGNYYGGWKEHFKKQPTRSVDLRDDGVDIDLLSREEREGALKYLKNNKATGAASIVAELLKNGGPNQVDALHTVIQQAWTGEKLD